MKTAFRSTAFAIILLAFTGISDAHAACTSPAGIEGSITWNGTNAVIWCDGTNWNSLASGGGGGFTALTGDVTASGTGSVAATIANSAVTYVKMQNTSAASVLLGRGAGSGAGNVQELTLGSGLSLSGTTLSATAGGTVSGTTNYVAKFTGASTVGNSQIFDDGTNIGIGTTTPSAKLELAGTRPITLSTSGNISARGDAGGWAFRFGAFGSSGTDRGGFGFLGSADALTNYWIGPSYTSPHVTILANGNVGIGTTAPGRLLTVAASTPYIRIQDNDSTGNTSFGYVEFTDSAGTRKGYVGDGSTGDSHIDLASDAGSVRAFSGANVCTYTSGASWSCSSDVRMKQDIQPLVGSLANIIKLQGVSYHWRDARKSGRVHVGLIAQEVEKVYPQVVGENDGMKVLDYSGLIAPLIEAIKELKADNDDLATALKAANDNDAARDADLEELRDEIEALKAAR